MRCEFLFAGSRRRTLNIETASKSCWRFGYHEKSSAGKQDVAIVGIIMDQTNITTDEAAACLRLLRRAGRPMTAAELAATLYFSGKRETQRRHVRLIVDHLRNTGAWIVANLQDGYFLTNDAVRWAKYNDERQIGIKQTFGVTHKRKKAALADRRGQGFLFNPSPRVCVW